MSKAYRHIKIIVNPISGSGRGLGEGMALGRFLQQQGVRIDTYITEQAGDAEQEARRTSIPIIVVGGDGTINEVINGLEGRRVPLMVFPIGTANLLSREFNLPRNRADFYSLIQSGAIHYLDVGQVYKPTNRRFLSVAGIGFDGEVTRLMQQTRMKSIHLYSYLLPLWQTLRHYSLPSFSLAIDDQTIADKATSVVIGNIKNYGGYFSITHRAEADDGWLDICVFPGKSRKDYLRYLVGVILGRPTIFSDVTYYRGKKVEIQSSHPVPIELDGDFRGYTPFACEVVPKSVFLLLSSPGPRVKRFVRKGRKSRRMKR